MAETFVKLVITSNLNAFHSERTFPLSISIPDLKCKLELLTGAPATSMQLELKTSEGKFVRNIDETVSHLNSLLNLSNGMIIHVTCKNDVQDISDQVEKFVISDEAYEARTDSVRAWKQKQKLAEYDPEYQKKKEAEAQKLLQESEQAAASIKVGQRCEVRIPNQRAKRGLVMFVGTTHFKPGHWVGVKYDEPVGKNDGSMDGKRYFQCPPKYGSFVKPQDVKVGEEFVEENLMDLDEI